MVRSWIGLRRLYNNDPVTVALATRVGKIR